MSNLGSTNLVQNLVSDDAGTQLHKGWFDTRYKTDHDEIHHNATHMKIGTPLLASGTDDTTSTLFPK